MLSVSEILLLPNICIGFCSAFEPAGRLLLINASLKLCLGATKVYWVENYFKYREQAVKIGNMFSSINLIATGNPFGIHLEPLLFYFLPLLMTQPRFVQQQTHHCMPMKGQPAARGGTPDLVMALVARLKSKDPSATHCLGGAAHA